MDAIPDEPEEQSRAELPANHITKNVHYHVADCLHIYPCIVYNMR
jgi:hypothetical protein